MLPEAQSCTSDDDCVYYGQKCCDDSCFKEKICKFGFASVIAIPLKSNITTRTTTTEYYITDEVPAT